MANLSLRISDDLLARFDGWACAHGGRAPALRRLIGDAAGAAPAGGRLGPRPLKLTVRLTAEDSRGIDREAVAVGLTANAWAGAVLRHRLRGRPTFPRDQTLVLIGMQAELRRIGINVNQIARALNVAVMEGAVLDLEMSAIDALGAEIRGHIVALREAFDGNLAYWQGEP